MNYNVNVNDAINELETRANCIDWGLSEPDTNAPYYHFDAIISNNVSVDEFKQIQAVAKEVAYKYNILVSGAVEDVSDSEQRWFKFNMALEGADRTDREFA